MIETVDDGGGVVDGGGGEDTGATSVVDWCVSLGDGCLWVMIGVE